MSKCTKDSMKVNIVFFVFKVNGQAPVRAVQCLPIYRPNPTHG